MEPFVNPFFGRGGGGALTIMFFNDFPFSGNDWWFFKNLLKLYLFLYKITFFHSSVLYSRHGGLSSILFCFRSLDSLL